MKNPFSNPNKPPAHAARRLGAVCLCAALFVDCTQFVRADVTNLIAIADTTLQDDPTLANLNYGLDDGIRAGGRQSPGKARGLLHFDLAGSIPNDATITSATLTLTVTATPTSAVNSTFDDAQSNRTSTVEFRDSLAAGNWNALTNLPAAPSNTIFHITNTISSDERYFRVATP